MHRLAKSFALGAVVGALAPTAAEAAETVRSQTPAAAIRSFVALLDRGPAGHLAACGLYSADALAVTGGDQETCAYVLPIALEEQEDPAAPRYVGSAVTALTVARRHGLTVARVGVRHRFRVKGGLRRTVTVSVRVALVREPGGWRLPTPQLLLPGGRRASAVPPSDADLRAELRGVAVQAAEARRVEARGRAQTSPVGEAQACPGPVAEVADPVGDVSGWSERGALPASRFPGVDVLAVRHSRAPAPCFALDVRGPLPAEFAVDVTVAAPGPGDRLDRTDALLVHVEDGRASASYETYEFEEGVLVPVAVGMSPDRRTITIRPTPADAWGRIVAGSTYRWMASVRERRPELRTDVSDGVPDTPRDALGDPGVPAPPAS